MGMWGCLLINAYFLIPLQHLSKWTCKVEDLGNIHAWNDEWQIICMATNCQTWSTSTRRSLITYLWHSPSLTFTILEVTIDQTFNYISHLSNYCIYNSKFEIVYPTVKDSPPAILTIFPIYKAYIRSVVKYSPFAWTIAAPTKLNKLDHHAGQSSPTDRYPLHHPKHSFPSPPAHSEGRVCYLHNALQFYDTAT